MTAWSDFVKAYASAHNITFSVAMKLSEVKDAYKIQKIALIEDEIELLEDEPVVELVVEPVVEAPVVKPSLVFISKKKRRRVVGVLD